MMGKSPRPCRLLLLLALVLLALTLPGCSGPPAEATPPGDAAASLQEIPGSDVKRIVLTEHAAGNIGLQTSATSTDPKSGKLTVPYLAVLYDSQGKTWVYTNPEPLVYVRQPVSVERIDGEVAQLSGGPAPGTTVVTLGAEELFGAELDTAN
jgi:hypothetical protein